MRRSRKALVAMLVAVMALCIAVPGTAFARAGSSGKAMNASWEVPTKPVDNWIQKDGKTYKVLTTWAMAWSTSGPDFLGINNSSFYGNGQNGNANVTDYKYGASSTLLGVWASAANEKPNAYNWNSWYNLYAKEGGSTGSEDLAQSDLACTSASWEGGQGVYGPFKYRPEIVWLCNNLSAAGALSNVKLINDGNYYASNTGLNISGTGEVKVDATKATAAAGDEKSAYYVEGDEAYNPFIIQPVNSNPYTFVDSAYELAYYADEVIANTKDYAGVGANETLNWKTMNKLPRSTRYTESPDECALNIEKVARGSVYYTLKQINDKKVDRKKVAYVTTVPGTIDDTHVAVAVYDYTEDISGNITASSSSAGMGGTASWSPLVVDQLGADKSLDVYAGVDHAVLTAAGSTGEGYTSVNRPTMTYSLYIADANDLASCDVIYATNTAYTVKQWQDFLSNNVSTKSARANWSKVKIFANTPYVCNGSNFTMDKLIYGAYALDCFYPELFPNLMLSTYWYDKVYHIKSSVDDPSDSSSLQNAMTWAFAEATIPEGARVNTSNYKASTVDGYFKAGLDYYNSAKGTDSTLKRVLASQALDGSTKAKDGSAYNYTCFEPSNTWLSKNGNEVAKQSQIIVIGGNTASDATITKALGDDAFELGARTSRGNGTLTYASDAPETASVDANGKVTLGTTVGTAKITVTAAETDTYKETTKTVAVKLTGKALSIKVADSAGVKVESKGEGRNATKINVIDKKITDTTIELGATAIDKDKKTVSGAKVEYASSDKNVATVDASGKVTIEGTGTATLSISASAEGYEAISKANKNLYEITLRVSALKQTISANDITKSLDDADAASPFALGATVSAESGGTAGTLSYQSGNPDVATVDASGNVTLKGVVGSATITVTAAPSVDCEAATKDVTVTATGKTQAITTNAVTAANKKYNASFNLGAKASGEGALSYKSETPKTATVDASGNVKIKGVGAVKIVVAADKTNLYNAATTTVSFTSTKADQPMTVKAKSVKVSYNAKKKQTIAAKKAFTVKGNQGAVSYKKAGSSKLSVSKTGAITVKKGLKKGKYSITVKVTAAGNGNYASGSKNVKVTVQVK